jgi:hypothetical protein
MIRSEPQPRLRPVKALADIETEAARAGKALVKRALILAGCCLALASSNIFSGHLFSGDMFSRDTPPPLADVSTMITVMVMDAKDTAAFDARPRRSQSRARMVSAASS